MQPRAPLPSPVAPEAASAQSRPHGGVTAAQGAGDAAGVGGMGAPAQCSAIVALSEDHLLLRALTLAVVEQAAVVTSPSVDRFIDQLVANDAAVALIDAAAAPAPIEGFVATLRRQFPHLLLVLTGSAQLQNELRAPIADGTIFRFAHKPVSAQRLKLFVSAALRRHQELTTPEPLTAAAPQAQRARAAARAFEPKRASRSAWRWALLVSLALAAALAGVWFAIGRALPPRSWLP